MVPQVKLKDGRYLNRMQRGNVGIIMYLFRSTGKNVWSGTGRIIKTFCDYNGVEIIEGELQNKCNKAFGARGCYAATIGNVTEGGIKKYIQEQYNELKEEDGATFVQQ